MKFFKDGLLEVENVFSDAEWQMIEDHHLLTAMERLIHTGYREMARSADIEEMRRVDLAAKYIAKAIGAFRCVLEQRQWVSNDRPASPQILNEEERLVLAARLYGKWLFSAGPGRVSCTRLMGGCLIGINYAYTESWTSA